jgi:putative transposase
MPWINVWLHFVWATKNHYPFLTNEIRPKLFQHIREYGRSKGIHIDHINGYVDHVHCLISLGNDQTLEKIMQLIKGESSFWINKSGLMKQKFSWQDEYFVVSVNPSSLGAVRRYVAKQDEHHKKVLFKQEFDDFLIRAGFQRFKDRIE